MSKYLFIDIILTTFPAILSYYILLIAARSKVISFLVTNYSRSDRRLKIRLSLISGRDSLQLISKTNLVRLIKQNGSLGLLYIIKDSFNAVVPYTVASSLSL